MRFILCDRLGKRYDDLFRRILFEDEFYLARAFCCRGVGLGHDRHPAVDDLDGEAVGNGTYGESSGRLDIDRLGAAGN